MLKPDQQPTAVARLDELPPGQQLEVNVDGQDILLCHTETGIYAVESLCTHMQRPLIGGRQHCSTMYCPHHAAKFDLATGKALSPPAFKALQTYSVTVSDETIYLSPLSI